MFPMMDPDKMKPMEEDEAVKKMASIGAIMEGAGDSFSEDDMRLFRDAFMGTNALEEQMEALISRYNGLSEDEEEEEGGKSKIKFAPLAVFCTFFVAELGDKTQLTAITFGANEGMGAACIVWIGCSLGLFLADILGMLVGYLLKSKTPDGLLNTLAFVIFAIFGIYTAYQALNLISESVCPITVWPLLAAVTVAFVVICVWLYMKKKKDQDVSADK